jgi:hypothetical protein
MKYSTFYVIRDGVRVHTIITYSRQEHNDVVGMLTRAGEYFEVCN